MTDTSKKITHLLEDQIPDYVQEFYPMFVIFVTKYFEYLETSGTGTQYSIQNIQLNRDIDTTANDLAIEFLKTYIPNLPANAAADRALLVKHFKDFYQRKGSEKSFRFFFRAFFGEDIEIDYPRNYMFRPSDANWYTEKRIRVYTTSSAIDNLKHTRVVGASSNSHGIVNDVIKVGTNVYDLVFQKNSISLLTPFTSGEAIVADYYNYDNNTSGQLTVTSITALITDAGRYLDDHSQLSANQVLQDSYYFQQFSYVLRNTQSREFWVDHVLRVLHPTGTIMFNDFLTDLTPAVESTSFAKTAKIETSVRIPAIKSFLTSPTYTFDRVADFYTGTSQTTTAGSIVYDVTYDYPGENITWALQGTFDSPVVREVARLGSASFDKLLAGIGLNDNFIAWPANVNSSLVVRRYNWGYNAYTSVTLTGTTVNIVTGVPFITSNAVFSGNQDLRVGSRITIGATGLNTTAYTVRALNGTSISILPLPITTASNQTSYTLRLEKNDVSSQVAANTLIFSTSNVAITNMPLTSSGSIGGMILLLTWMKNSKGNAPNEGNNAVVLRLTSNVVVTPYFDNEVQENYKEISLADSLSYRNLIYYHSSNSIQTSNISGLPVTSTTIVFKPFNNNRGQTYDRLSLRITVGDQANQNLTETFSTANITASGLIASWSDSSITSTQSTSTFTSVGTSLYAFSSNCFVFNGATSVSRFIQTVTLPGIQTAQVNMSYVVGDGYNGGEAPDANENLVLQYSTNGGTTWITSATIWSGGSFWSSGTRKIAGQVWTTTGSTSIVGINTLFLSEFNVGDRITVSSTTGVAYTIASIVNNLTLNVTAPVTSTIRTAVSNSTPFGRFLTDAVANSSIVYGAGTNWTTGLLIGQSITLGTSTNTAYTITGIASDTAIFVTPNITTSTHVVSTLTAGAYVLAGSNVVTSVNNTFSLSTGSIIKFNNSSVAATSYIVTNVYGTSSIGVSPTPVENLVQPIQLSGVVWSNSSNLVTGIGTTFSTQLTTGRVVTIGTSGITDLYVVTNIWSNTSISVRSTSLTALTGNITFTAGSSWVTITGQSFVNQLTTGSIIMIGSAGFGTSYTVVSRPNNSSVTVTPNPTQTRTTSAVVRISVVNRYVSSLTYLTGQVFTSANGIYVTGVGTQFTTDLAAGRSIILSANQSVITSYVVQSILSNTALQLVSAPTTGTLARLVGTVNTGPTGSVSGVGTQFTIDLATGDTVIMTLGGSSASIVPTTYTVTNINTNTDIVLSGTPPAATSAVFIHKVATISSSLIGGVAAFRNQGTTSYGITGTTGYVITGGADTYYKIPVSQQFQTTSITAYSSTTQNITLRLIQTNATGPAHDVYALDSLNVVTNAGSVSSAILGFSVSVSSGAVININDNDYFDITSIGTL